MGSVPKLLFALLLLLPGGFILGPAFLFVQRWRARHAADNSQTVSSHAQPMLAAHASPVSSIANSQAPA